MWKTWLEPVPGRLVLRKLLLRFDADDRLFGKPIRTGRLVKLSRRSASCGSCTSQTDEEVFFRFSAAGGTIGSNNWAREPSSSDDDTPESSSSDHTDDTFDR